MLSELLRRRSDDKPAPSNRTGKRPFPKAKAAGTPTATTPPADRRYGKSSPSTPSTEARVEAGAKARRGAPSNNDGRADRPLQSDGHVGSRDQQIEQLKKSQTELQQDRTKLQDEIENIESDIKSGTTKSGIVSTVVDVATAPVAVVSALFGRSNPVADKAEDVTEQLLGLNEKRDDLKQNEQDLASQQQAIKTQIRELEQGRALNFLADVAHVTNMPNAVADVLEGDGSVPLKFVSGTATKSDAAYSSDDRSISIDEKVLDKVNTNFDELRDKGIVDEDGRILDAVAFDSSSAGDAAISSAALIAVHETTHGADDEHGVIDHANAAGSRMVDDATKMAKQVDGPAGAAMIDEARIKAEKLRIDHVEYDAYVNQETIELQAGKEKQGFITINSDGSLLPRKKAVENIYQFQMGAPLLHGESAGQTFGGVVDEHEHDGEAPGRRAPGTDAPGRRAPGTDAPGRRAPGDDAPGRRAPGFETG